MCQVCPICVNSVERPFRRQDQAGQIVEGCVHPCHDNFLPTNSNTRAWAMRKSVKALRKLISKYPARNE